LVKSARDGNSALEIRQLTDIRQIQTISPQFILSQRLLQLPSMELMQELRTELAENPALELVEVQTCPHCHRPMEGGRCEYCGKKPDLEDEKLEQFIQQKGLEYDREESYYDEPAGDGEEDAPIGQFAQQAGSFNDYLISNFLSTGYPKELRELGEYLIYSIDDNGFLKYDIEELKEKFGVSEEEVKGIVRIIQALDPPGVGGESASGALLIQLAMLTEEGKGNPLAERIIGEHFEDLGKGRYEKISEALQVPVSKIIETLQYIRRNLNPYPARAYTGRAPEPVMLTRPSIVIKYDGKDLNYEVLELSDFQLRINKEYLDIYENHQAGAPDTGRAEIAHIREYFRRAKFFIDSIGQRKQTLEKIAQALCEEQREFLIQGLPHFNDSLTQGRLAEKIGLHESTVSRAMSGKFVLVPGDEILSFDFFFDSSVRPKEYIRNIVANESQENPVSDSELRDILIEKGIDIARRTVAKYREDMGIPSSYDRRRIRR
jgi:RNA polymerase sigma-54 factor